MLQKLWALKHNRYEILHFERSAILCTLQLLHTTLRIFCGRITVRCERNAGSVRGFAIQEHYSLLREAF